jgi:hypothetical protein
MFGNHGTRFTGSEVVDIDICGFPFAGGEFKNLESGVHELWLVKCGVSGVESNSSGHFDIGRDRQPWEDYDGNTMS